MTERRAFAAVGAREQTDIDTRIEFLTFVKHQGKELKMQPTRKAKKRTADKNLEQIVIGACMRYAEQWEQCSRIIRTADVFREYPHIIAWRAMLSLAKDGLPTDPATVFDWCVKNGVTEDLQPAYLVDLWDASPGVSVAHHARTLLDLFVRRQVTLELDRSKDLFEDPATSPLATVEVLKTRLESIAGLIYDDTDQGDEDKALAWKPFPVETLPSIMQDYCLAGAEALRCDPAFLAMPALVTAAACIGNSRFMHIKASWIEPCVLWGAIVADSSSLKSPSMDMACSPLSRIQRDLSKGYDAERTHWEEQMEEWRSSRYAKANKTDPHDVIPRPKEPTPHKILVSDITIEKLAHVLWQNPQGVCLLREELSGWFASFGCYKDGGGASADMANWLSIYGARSWNIDRKGGDPPSIYVPRANCSVFGTIQPKKLRKMLTEDYFDTGLAARLIFAMPPKKPKGWTEDVIPEHVHEAYHETMMTIRTTGEDHLSAFANEPKQIHFTSAGKTAWIEFYSEWADRQNHAEGEFAYALGKLEAICARLSLIFCVFEKASVSSRREEVTEGHVKRVFELVKWFAHEIERVYRMLREPEQANAMDRLIEFIRNHGGEMTPTRLHKSNPSRYETAADAEAMLSRLVERNMGKWVSVPPGPKGGRTARKFALAPDKT